MGISRQTWWKTHRPCSPGPPRGNRLRATNSSPGGCPASLRGNRPSPAGLGKCRRPFTDPPQDPASIRHRGVSSDRRRKRAARWRWARQAQAGSRGDRGDATKTSRQTIRPPGPAGLGSGRPVEKLGPRIERPSLTSFVGATRLGRAPKGSSTIAPRKLLQPTMSPHASPPDPPEENPSAGRPRSRRRRRGRRLTPAGKRRLLRALYPILPPLPPSGRRGPARGA